MNKSVCDILIKISERKGRNTSQRELAADTGNSVGFVNKAIKELEKDRYIEVSDGKIILTDRGNKLIKEGKPKSAIIMAAGLGMRMIPINREIPKGLLEVKGETLIERLINQLHQAGVEDITVIVGFMKEAYEFLIDTYGVELVVNRKFAESNNLHSLNLAADKLSNTYIMPSDVWCRENPFNKTELYSWYMVSEAEDPNSDVRITRKNELKKLKNGETGNKMIGISYLTKADSQVIRYRLSKMDGEKKYNDSFWEETLYEENGVMRTAAKVLPERNAIEINTYEELRDLDQDSNQLKNDAIEVIANTLKVDESDITDINTLKKGMTNRSFIFSAKGKRYIMRIPGEGSENLINRRQEYEAYMTVKGKNICDDPLYINPENGYKITEFVEDNRCCDAASDDDIKKCMTLVHKLHSMKLKNDYEFDFFKLIDFYETLWDGEPSIYRDYTETKRKILSLKEYIDANEMEHILTHIDANQDNFLISEENGAEKIQLIDWEYASMQDPDVDPAMFIIYAMYKNRYEVDRFIDLYFESEKAFYENLLKKENASDVESGCYPLSEKEIKEKFSDEILEKRRTKIYCYMAVSGLLWSNWCEYKRNLGVEFGEYSLAQYRYAKDYYTIAKARIDSEK